MNNIDVNLQHSELPQLWSLYIDSEVHNFIGIIEINASMKSIKDIDFESNPPLAARKLDKLPKDQEAYYNILTDMMIISIVPNMFLYLEAVYEKKTEEIQDFHMNVYEATRNSLTKINKSLEEKFESLDRVNKPFKYTASKGWIINQHGQKVIKFADEKLAQWTALGASQFHNVFNFSFNKTLISIGAGPMISIGADGQVSVKDLNEEAKHKAQEDYLNLKSMLSSLDWCPYENLKKIKIFLE